MEGASREGGLAGGRPLQAHPHEAQERSVGHVWERGLQDAGLVGDHLRPEVLQQQRGTQGSCSS